MVLWVPELVSQESWDTGSQPCVFTQARVGHGEAQGARRLQESDGKTFPLASSVCEAFATTLSPQPRSDAAAWRAEEEGVTRKRSLMTGWVLNHSLEQTAEQTPEKVSAVGINKLDAYIFRVSPPSVEERTPTQT